MVRKRIAPMKIDYAVARTIARHTSPGIEKSFRSISASADERILAAAALGYLLWAYLGAPHQKRNALHLFADTAAAAIIPHIIKQLFAQQRPDRKMVHEKRRGIPRSSKAYDSFPSGHAMQVGALTMALSSLFPSGRPVIWLAGGAIAASRIILLAHWVSDVVAGLAAGMTIEAILWRLERKYVGARHRHRR